MELKVATWNAEQSSQTTTDFDQIVTHLQPHAHVHYLSVPLRTKARKQGLRVPCTLISVLSSGQDPKESNLGALYDPFIMYIR